MRNITRTLEAILLDKESDIYMRNAERAYYGEEPLTQERAEKFWRGCYKVRGKRLVTSETYGVNKNGRWHFWTVPEIKDMLTKAGLEYEDTDPVETIDVYL